MEERKNIVDYIEQVFTLFGIMMVIMMIFSVSFGEDAKEISEMFLLGNDGISISIMCQYFVIAVITVVLRILFFTDYVIHRMPVMLRTLCMVTGMVITIAVFVIRFNWFPMNEALPWLMFGLCFLVCFVTSYGVMILRTKLENRRLEKGLNRLQEKYGRNEDDNE